MSCATCLKRRGLDNIINLGKAMAAIEEEPYAVINKNDVYDFIKLEQAIREGKKIIKVLPVN